MWPKLTSKNPPQPLVPIAKLVRWWTADQDVQGSNLDWSLRVKTVFFPFFTSSCTAFTNYFSFFLCFSTPPCQNFNFNSAKQPSHASHKCHIRNINATTLKLNIFHQKWLMCMPSNTGDAKNGHISKLVSNASFPHQLLQPPNALFMVGTTQNPVGRMQSRKFFLHHQTEHEKWWNQVQSVCRYLTPIKSYRILNITKNWILPQMCAIGNSQVLNRRIWSFLGQMLTQDGQNHVQCGGI